MTLVLIEMWRELILLVKIDINLLVTSLKMLRCISLLYFVCFYVFNPAIMFKRYDFVCFFSLSLLCK